MEYDPATDQWSEKKGYPGPLRENGVVFSIGDCAYFGMGRESFRSSAMLKDLWKYDPRNDTWTKVVDFPGNARWNATAFSHNGKAYVGLGHQAYYGQSPSYKDIWEYDPYYNKWEKLTDYPGSTSYYDFGIGLNNKIYIVGEESWEYDMSKKSWKRMGDYPGYKSVPFKINNSIYAASGSNVLTIWKLNRYE